MMENHKNKRVRGDRSVAHSILNFYLEEGTDEVTLDDLLDYSYYKLPEVVSCIEEMKKMGIVSNTYDSPKVTYRLSSSNIVDPSSKEFREAINKLFHQQTSNCKTGQTV